MQSEFASETSQMPEKKQIVLIEMIVKDDIDCSPRGWELFTCGMQSAEAHHIKHLM